MSRTLSEKSGQIGMTLLELLIVMAVIAILATLVGPGLQDTLARSQVRGARNNLHSAMQLARSEALRIKTSVSVCSSADQRTCGGVNDWQTGWIVFSDANGNGSINAGAGEQVISVQYNENALVNFYQTPANVVTFSRIGAALSGAGNFGLCHERAGLNGLLVQVAITGSISSDSETIGGC